jgi:hypothetical protein
MSYLLTVRRADSGAKRAVCDYSRDYIKQCRSIVTDKSRPSFAEARSNAQLLTWCYVIFAVMAVSCSTESREPSFARPRSDQPLVTQPEQLTLYSIDGREFEPGEAPKTEETFHGYPVLGKIVVTDPAKRAELMTALKKGLADGPEDVADCFWPRHAIQTVDKGRTVDYIICFECLQMEIHGKQVERAIATTIEPERLFNRHLRAASIPIAPASF